MTGQLELLVNERDDVADASRQDLINETVDGFQIIDSVSEAIQEIKLRSKSLRES